VADLRQRIHHTVFTNFRFPDPVVLGVGTFKGIAFWYLSGFFAKKNNSKCLSQFRILGEITRPDQEV
jgi:hypothetical protein